MMSLISSAKKLLDTIQKLKKKSPSGKIENTLEVTIWQNKTEGWYEIAEPTKTGFRRYKYLSNAIFFALQDPKVKEFLESSNVKQIVFKTEQV